MTENANAVVTEPPGVGRGKPLGLFARLFGAPAVLRAQRELARLSPEQIHAAQQAQLAYELGKLALAPGHAVVSGSTAPLAANLFRQSIYWSLVSQRAAPDRPRPSDAWGSATPELLARLSRVEAERARVGQLLPRTFVELAAEPAEIQTSDARLLRRCAERLLGVSGKPLLRLELYELGQALRVGAFAALVLACLLAVWVLFIKPRDLAAGKPWRTSSIGIVCTPEKGDCGGVSTDILFHTKEEQDPWFEYDLGTATDFSSLVVKNRTDFGPDRAVPLIAEVSNDDKNFREVARRDMVFGTWRPQFPKQHARYVRLRVPRKSILHLEQIEVHP